MKIKRKRKTKTKIQDEETRSLLEDRAPVLD
jgi:hypothetical protein